MDGVVPGVVGQLFGEVVLPLIAPAVCCPELGLARGGSWLAPIPQTLSDRAWQRASPAVGVLYFFFCMCVSFSLEACSLRLQRALL